MKYQKLQYTLFAISLFSWFAWIVWWILLRLHHGGSGDNYSDSYGFIALSGGLASLMAAKHWGMFRSTFGRALAFLGLGLVLQFLGQFIYAFLYRAFGQDLAFPSVGDIPYVLSDFAYIVGLYYLFKTITFGQSIFASRWPLIIACVSTVLVLAGAYYGFLHIAIHDDRGFYYRLLNVLYPAVQSVYFLLGIAALIRSQGIAKGKLFGSVFLVLIALIIQYIADFTFLYQSYHDTWVAGGINDLCFLTAYGLMTLAIFNIEKTRRQ